MCNREYENLLFSQQMGLCNREYGKYTIFIEIIDFREKIVTFVENHDAGSKTSTNTKTQKLLN